MLLDLKYRILISPPGFDKIWLDINIKLICHDVNTVLYPRVGFIFCVHFSGGLPMERAMSVCVVIPARQAERERYQSSSHISGDKRIDLRIRRYLPSNAGLALEMPKGR